jgi:hypothetical protein
MTFSPLFLNIFKLDRDGIFELRKASRSSSCICNVQPYLQSGQIDKVHESKEEYALDTCLNWTWLLVVLQLAEGVPVNPATLTVL